MTQIGERENITMFHPISRIMSSQSMNYFIDSLSSQIIRFKYKLSFWITSIIFGGKNIKQIQNFNAMGWKKCFSSSSLTWGMTYGDLK